MMKLGFKWLTAYIFAMKHDVRDRLIVKVFYSVCTYAIQTATLVLHAAALTIRILHYRLRFGR